MYKRQVPLLQLVQHAPEISAHRALVVTDLSHGWTGLSRHRLISNYNPQCFYAFPDNPPRLFFGLVRAFKYAAEGKLMKCLDSSKQSSRITAAGLFLMVSGALFANNSKISPDLQPLLANPSGTVNVIVQYSAPQKCSGLLGQLPVSYTHLPYEQKQKRKRHCQANSDFR